MTQLELARKKRITPQMRYVAKRERIDAELLRQRIAAGEAVILHNRNHKNAAPIGIGKGLRTKINVNIGTSPNRANLKRELEKLKVSICHGADAVMDLSTAGETMVIRKAILKNSPVPVGTVPIYETAVRAARRGNVSQMTCDEMLATIESHAKDGVDFMTIHCGMTNETLKRLKKEGRLIEVVSRGGSFLAEWIIINRQENPLYEHFDEIIKIAKEYDVTLSLGDGLRPGSIVDATDRTQIQELILLGELAQRAVEQGVSVIIEGPGHVPLDQIEANVILEKRLCHGAPFYVLGPLVTDIAPGYDHIVGAIGGAIAASCGADFLCCVTPAEHLRFPTLDDVKEGTIASKIAAHSADIAKGITGAIERDENLSKARKKRDWEAQKRLSINPEKFEKMNETSSENDTCSMCNNYCSMKRIEKYLRKGDITENNWFPLKE